MLVVNVCPDLDRTVIAPEIAFSVKRYLIRLYAESAPAVLFDFFLAAGIRNCLSALASIWRTRSRVIKNMSPISCKVCSRLRSMPNRCRNTICCRELRIDNDFLVTEQRSFFKSSSEGSSAVDP